MHRPSVRPPISFIFHLAHNTNKRSAETMDAAGNSIDDAPAPRPQDPEYHTTNSSMMDDDRHYNPNNDNGVIKEDSEGVGGGGDGLLLSGINNAEDAPMMMGGGAAPAVLGAAGGMIDDHDHPTHGGGNDQGMMMHGGGDDMSGGGGGEGNLVLRPIFCGNLSYGCSAADLENVFRNPSGGGQPFDLDRVVSCIYYYYLYI